MATRTRLPDARQLGERVTPEAMRMISTYREGLKEAGRVEANLRNAHTFGNLARTGEQMHDANDRMQFAKAKSDFLTAKIQADNSFDEDKDYGTWEARYAEKLNAAKDKAIGSIGNARYREAFMADTAPDFQRGIEVIKDRARKRNIDDGRATAFDAISKNIELAASAPDEQTRASIMLATGETIAAARDSGFYSAEESARLLAETDKRFQADHKARMVTTLESDLDKARNSILTDPRKLGSAESELMGKIDGSGLGQADKDKLKDKVRNGLGLSAVQAQILNNPEAAQTALKSGAWDRYLDGDRKAAAMASADHAIKVNQALAKAELAEKRERFNSDFEIALTRGEKTHADIEEGYRNGLITPGSRTRYTKYLDNELERQQGVAAMVARVTAAGDGGQPLDPKNTEDKKALNLHYSASLANWKPDEVVPRSIDYANRYGIVPEQFRGVIRGNLRSGDAGQALMASDTIRQLRNLNPQLLNDFADEDLRLGNLVGSLTDAGMPPQQALQYAVDSLRVDKTTREARSTDYNLQRGKTEQERSQSDSKWMADKLDNAWFSDPTIDPVMRAEFDTLARSEFEKTGNLDASRQFALDNVNRVWGETRVGGDRRFMKWAPEKMYGVDTLSPKENAAWMSEQLLADVGKGAAVDPENPLTADRIILAPDPTRTHNGRPVYTVSVKGSDGVLYPIGKRWVPDWNLSAEKVRREQAAARDLERARQERERRFSPTVGPELTNDEIDRAIERGPPYPAAPPAEIKLTPETASKSGVSVFR